jgi:hypothetical protein
MASVPAKKIVSISPGEIGTLESIIENRQEPFVNNHDRLLDQDEVAMDRADDSGFSPVCDGGEGPDHYFIVYLKWNSGHLTGVYIGGPVFNSTVQLLAGHVLEPIIEPHALSPCILTSRLQLSIQAFACRFLSSS